MDGLHPIRLVASLHETIWGGRSLERIGWKTLPEGEVLIGEAWETAITAVAQNEPYAGKTLGTLVEELGPALLGEQVMTIFGRRFPLLTKFIDANAQLSVQVHPDDGYASKHANGSLGKTECWYILNAPPGASIVHGFKAPTSRDDVQRAIEEVRLEDLLHEEQVHAGDVIFVPAGTVHAIGGGILLYELQEYSDITYRLYDYGRLTAAGTPRELHIEKALDVAVYTPSPRIKVHPVRLVGGTGYQDRCLVACRYFLVRELNFAGVTESRAMSAGNGAYMDGETGSSCVILTSLVSVPSSGSRKDNAPAASTGGVYTPNPNANSTCARAKRPHRPSGGPSENASGTETQVRYGASLKNCELLSAGQTMVLPAALGTYRIEGMGKLLLSYVPAPDDEAWRLWNEKNGL